MGTYASRRGPPDSPNVPDAFIFPEEEQVIDLMDEIDERGDRARDEITALVRTLCTRIAKQENELDHRPAVETTDSCEALSHDLEKVQTELDAVELRYQRLVDAVRHYIAHGDGSSKMLEVIDGSPVEPSPRRMTRLEADQVHHAMERAFWRSVEIIDPEPGPSQEWLDRSQGLEPEKASERECSWGCHYVGAQFIRYAACTVHGASSSENGEQKHD